MRALLLALLAVVLYAAPAVAAPEDNLYGVSRFANIGSFDHVYQNTSGGDRKVNIVAIDHNHVFMYVAFFISPDGVNFYSISRDDGQVYAHANVIVPDGYYYAVMQGCVGGMSPCIDSTRGIEVWREW